MQSNSLVKNKFQEAKNYWEEIKSEVNDYDLAIVIPAFNEEKRITQTLRNLQSYFLQSGLNFQVIVVDDGSSDQTTSVVIGLAKEINNLSVITLEINRGKGFAIKTGVLSSRAKKVLFCDADGATPFEEFKKLSACIELGREVVIGSRAMPAAEVKLETNRHRKLMGRAFNKIVNLVILPDIYDTQCGFKLFSAKAAHQLFFLLQQPRFSFDLEIIYLAKRLNFSFQEVAVNWQNQAGSKVNLVFDSIEMFIAIFKLRFFWLLNQDKF